jgi:hypothetical protein
VRDACGIREKTSSLVLRNVVLLSFAEKLSRADKHKKVVHHTATRARIFQKGLRKLFGKIRNDAEEFEARKAGK